MNPQILWLLVIPEKVIQNHRIQLENEMKEQKKIIEENQVQVQHGMSQQNKMIQNNESRVISLRESQDEREQKFGNHIVQNIIS